MFFLVNPYNKPQSWFMVAASGAYAISGQLAGLVVSKGLAASAGTFVVNGQPVALFKGQQITAEKGDYTLAGQSVQLLAALKMPADVGAFSISGQLAGLFRQLSIAAGAGSYSVDGLAAVLQAARTMAADSGDYSYDGYDIIMNRGILMFPDPGSFLIDGKDMAFVRSYQLAADVGAYLLGGQDAQMDWNHPLAAALGTYALSGMSAILKAAIRMAADRGIYDIAGQDAMFIYSGGYTMPAAAGALDLTGQDAALGYMRPMAALAGAYNVTGVAATLTRQLVMAAEAGSFTLSGQAATLTYTSFPTCVLAGYAMGTSAGDTSSPSASLTTLAPRTGKWIITVASRKGTSGTQVNPTTVTLNGTGLTSVIARTNTRQNVSIWISTTDITVDGTDTVATTWGTNQASARLAVAVYAVDGPLNSTTSVDGATGTGGSPSLNVNVSANGFVVGAATNLDGASNIVWTGITEDVDIYVPAASNEEFSSASAYGLAAATPRTVSLSISGSVAEAAAVTASFR